MENELVMDVVEETVGMSTNKTALIAVGVVVVTTVAGTVLYRRIKAKKELHVQEFNSPEESNLD